jgi:cytosine/adenosine deaminase-related metal-dependent hydrolase
MLIWAGRVYPVSSPVIENGAILIEKDKIIAVGKKEKFGKPDLDLGNSILMPGLVNAHCHLEHSALKNKTAPRLPYTQWAKEVSFETSRLTPEQKKESEKEAIQTLLRGGATTVADHSSPDTEIGQTPFRRIPFWEVLGANEQRGRENLQKCRHKEEGFISPHSLYAVHEEILEEIFNKKKENDLFSIHLLESDDEDRFFRKQDGPLAVYVQERGGDLSFPVSSPIKWLAANRWLGSHTLLVHGNYLSEEEIELLQRYGAGVIHSPGSHQFFGHRRFPLEELKKRGIPVALATDSFASNESLSMLREMRLLKTNYPDLTSDEILRMATEDGAKILRMGKEIGTLEPGKKADLIAVAGPDFLNATDVNFMMIDGQTVKI